MIHPFKEYRRLLLAGIDLRPHNSGIVDISEAEILGPDDKPIPCTDLRRGMAVKIFGRMIPHTPTDIDPNPVRLKAFTVNVIHVRHVGGRVLSVIQGDSGRIVLELAVPIDKVEGFDQPAPCVTVPCPETVKLKVILSKLLYNPDNIAFDETLVDQDIRAAGYFIGEPATADSPRKTFFFAIVVRKGLPQKDPISPLADVVSASTAVQ